MPRIPAPSPYRNYISLDTETTGVDLYHGAKPFIVTTCDGAGDNEFWQWYVDPFTRDVQTSQADIQVIQERINSAEKVILQNPKFDVKALSNIGITLPWEKIEDTLVMGHLLASNEPHNLTDMVVHYLKMNIQKYEDKLERCCKRSRNFARTHLKDWMIADPGKCSMPSVSKGGDKDKAKKRGSELDTKWKFDAWLPRAIARKMKYPKKHPYWRVAIDYANTDSSSTRLLYLAQLKICQKRDLIAHYKERMKLLPVVAAMEGRGVTLSGGRLRETVEKYGEESSKCKEVCEGIAKKRKFFFAGKDGTQEKKPLTLPRGARSDALQSFVFDCLKLPVVRLTEKKNPAMDKKAIELWTAMHESNKESDEYKFIKALSDKRSRDTAITYLTGYQRFWFKLKKYDNWYRLHPNFNPTGTDTLRFGCSNPNAQNVSKKKGFNLRYAFGPAPGREWWALDYENLELRIPAYEAGETLMTDLFERPNVAPFFGSYHMLVFSILHPKMWQEALNKYGPEGAADFVKSDAGYKSTWYQWTKNGNFAVQYGAQESSGTADAAYHVKGGQRIIQDRFTNIKVLSSAIIRQANRTGYVETMPRKSVHPTKGYPLLCTRTQYNRILPTVPLSYHVQGTAMEATTGAMIRCDHPLNEWSRREKRPHFITIQVHDELVFDFPKGKTPQENLPKVLVLRKLMEESGDDIGVPLKVSVGYHPCNWSETQAI